MTALFTESLEPNPEILADPKPAPRLNPELRFFSWPHHLLPVVVGWQHDPSRVTDETIAEALGCCRETVGRLRKAGLDYWTADRLATRVLRLHPEQVWSNWRYRTTLALLMGDA